MARINVYRNKEYESTVQIVRKTDMFLTIAHFLTFCAHYGMANKKTKKVLPKERGPDLNLYSHEDYLKDVYTIAWAHSNDISILNDKVACAEIFEIYLNGGLSEIHKKITRNLSRDPNGSNTLKSLLQELRNKIKDVEDDEDDSVPLPKI